MTYSLTELERDYRKADALSKQLAEKTREASAAGATRARITTLNANWANAAQERDEAKKRFLAAGGSL